MDGKCLNVAKKFLRVMRCVETISTEETYPSQDPNICQDARRLFPELS